MLSYCCQAISNLLNEFDQLRKIRIETTGHHVVVPQLTRVTYVAKERSSHVVRGYCVVLTKNCTRPEILQ